MTRRTAPLSVPVSAQRQPQPTTSELADDRTAGGSGTAEPSVATTSADESSNPSLPNERDEKVGMTGGVPDARVQQGARDLKRGLHDTSRGAEADAAYRKLKQ